MNVRRAWLVRLMALTLTLSWAFPLQRLAAADALANSTATELSALPVKLDATGVLQGTVMQAGGKPANRQMVVLGHQGKPVARTITDEQGRFQFGPVRPGQYQLVSSEMGVLLDCQEMAKSPKEAVDHVVLSQEGDVVRGNTACDSCGNGGGSRVMGNALMHPLFVGLVIAAAIAIPIAIAGNDDDAS